LYNAHAAFFLAEYDVSYADVEALADADAFWTFPICLTPRERNSVQGIMVGNVTLLLKERVMDPVCDMGISLFGPVNEKVQRPEVRIHLVLDGSAHRYQRQTDQRVKLSYTAQ